MKKPKWRFKERRPASARLEHPESVRFRDVLYQENADEVRQKFVEETDRELGFPPGFPDRDALNKISWHCFDVFWGGVKYPAISPKVDWQDPSEFDAAVCAAGLKQFVRRILDSDMPFPMPGRNAILVREMTPGIRSRLFFTLDRPEE